MPLFPGLILIKKSKGKCLPEIEITFIKNDRYVLSNSRLNKCNKKYNFLLNGAFAPGRKK
jgi:hypothetical protein